MCKCFKTPKQRPYGSFKRGVHWCNSCDANLVASSPSKKSERNRSKLEIKKELKRIGR
jgi:hypothetical protein